VRGLRGGLSGARGMSIGLSRSEAAALVPPLTAALAERQRMLAGIGLTLLSSFIFAGCNVTAKWVELRVPVSELLFVRAVTALLLISLAIRPRDFAAMRAGGRWWLHVMRASFSAIETSCYYVAVMVLQLADASTIYLAAPIYVTALSAIFLRERVGWRRWTAVGIGFAGVVVALHPTGAGVLNVYALICAAGSLLYAIALVATRRLRGTPTPLLVATQMGALLLGTATRAAGWPLPSLVDGTLLVLMGAASMLAYFCLNRALALAQASALAPFNYTSIIWALISGYLVFGDVPTVATLAGAAIIVGAGLFILFRVRRGGGGGGGVGGGRSSSRMVRSRVPASVAGMREPTRCAATQSRSAAVTGRGRRGTGASSTTGRPRRVMTTRSPPMARSISSDRWLFASATLCVLMAASIPG
jgi:drug/metabolite transporter (DMT)-like permease